MPSFTTEVLVPAPGKYESHTVPWLYVNRGHDILRVNHQHAHTGAPCAMRFPLRPASRIFILYLLRRQAVRHVLQRRAAVVVADRAAVCDAPDNNVKIQVQRAVSSKLLSGTGQLATKLNGGANSAGHHSPSYCDQRYTGYS